jgi:hypothetical protein
MPDDVCPVAVAGTSVTVEETANGGALVFTTTGDVAELRRRVGAMVAMHHVHHAGGDMHAGGDLHGGGDLHAGGDMHGGGPPASMTAIMHATVAASDIEGGARIDAEAAPGEASALQAALREHAAHMSAEGCNMHDHDDHDDHGGHDADHAP